MTQKTNGAPSAGTDCAPQINGFNSIVQDATTPVQLRSGPKPIPFLESYYTVCQVAAQFKISTTTVRKAFRGRPGVLDVADRRPGRHWYSSMRIPESAIRAYIAERSIQ